MIVTHAKKGDEIFLYRLKNDVQVRKNSLITKKISSKEHHKWFIKRLKIKPKILIFSKNKIQFGQVRIDKNLDGFYEIDYSIIKSFRGRGYSTKMLKKALKIYSRKKIIAKVKYNNKISKKVFAKLKFRILKKEKKYIIFSKIPK